MSATTTTMSTVTDDQNATCRVPRRSGFRHAGALDCRKGAQTAPLASYNSLGTPVPYGMPTYSVYVIADPRTAGVVKYVGMTTDVERRIKEHRRRTSPLGEWLRRLQAEGLTPTVHVHCTTTSKREAMEREYGLIGLLRGPCGCEFNAPTLAPSWVADEIASRMPRGFDRMDARYKRFPV